MNTSQTKVIDDIDGRALSEAIEWLTLIQSSKITPGEQEKFLKWLQEDPDHQRAFIRAESLWQCGNVLAHVKPEYKKSLRFAFPPLWLGGAVTACVVLALALFFNPVSPPEQRVYASGAGERPVYTLSDGSLLRLNVDTRLRVDFSKRGERRVFLEQGESFFKVAHNAESPFVVSTAEGEVRVLGTEFSVKTDSSATEVTVLQGKVQVAAQARVNLQPVTLVKDQFSRVDSKAIEISPVDASRALSWRDGLVHFSGETLRDVIAELNRYYDEELVLEDSGSEATKVVVVLRLDSSLRENAEILAANIGLQVTQPPAGKRIVLRAASSHR